MNKKPNKLTPREALEKLQEGALLVDIRPEYETNYRVIDVPYVYLMEYSTYRETFNNISKDISLIIVDSVGLQSSQVAQFILDKGYIEVAYITGGIIAWKQCGLPLTKDLDYQLNGGCACMLRTKK